MNFKQKCKRFLTLQHKPNAGFTLVELIVVIAIMGILAGVGTVGYAGYIKAANKNMDITTAKNVMHAVDVAGKSYAFDVQNQQVSANGLQVPVGFIILSNKDISDADGNSQGYVYLMRPESDTSNEGLLDEVLTAAFGSDFDNTLKLLSDTWKGTNISSMFASADDLYGDLQDMAKLVADDTVQSLISKVGFSLQKEYTSEIDVAATIAEQILAAHPTEDSFVEAWCATEGHAHGTQYFFGISGMENYTAVRAAYNEAVASYIESNSDATHATTLYNYGNSSLFGYAKCETYSAEEAATTHADNIRDFYVIADEWIKATAQSTMKGMGMVTSDVIQSSLFIDPDNNEDKGDDDCGGTQNRYGKYDKTEGSLPDGTQLCPTCAALVAKYCDTDAAKADARAFYQTMVTLAEGRAAAEAYAAEHPDEDEWAYYDDYVNSFSDLYADLETVTNRLESAIIITVYYNPSTKIMYAECNTPGVIDEE